MTFNPKDISTFASASLDRTVKVWSIGQPAPNFTLEGHEKGVNSVDYFSGGDRPYLISGADDKTAKVPPSQPSSPHITPQRNVTQSTSHGQAQVVRCSAVG